MPTPTTITQPWFEYENVEGYTKDKIDKVGEEKPEQHNQSATRTLAKNNENLLGYEEGRESGEMQNHRRAN